MKLIFLPWEVFEEREKNWYLRIEKSKDEYYGHKGAPFKGAMADLRRNCLMDYPIVM